MSKPLGSKPLGANYWRLWTASVVSNFGDGLSSVAYPWLASAVTRDPLHIALIGVATRLPWLLFTLPAGVITDRVDRRRLVVAMDTLRTVITLGVAGIVLAHQSQLAPPETIAQGGASVAVGNGLLLATLYVSALLFGLAEVLRDNTAQTLMPSIVDKENLERANGRLWGAEMVMNAFAGPPVGGFLLAVAFSLPFFVDAGTFAVAAVLIALVTGKFRPEPPTTRPSFTADLKEGVRWLWGHRLLRRFAVALGLINASTSAAGATIVLYAQEVLGLDAAQFGLLASAGALGGIAGSFLAPRVSDRLGPGANVLLCVAIIGVAYAVIGFTSSAIVVWAMYGAISVGVVLWNVVTVSLRQAIIPDRLLGRVNSVYRFFGWGMMPIGIFLGGLTVDLVAGQFGRLVGLRAPLFLASAVSIGLLVYSASRFSNKVINQARAEAETS